MGHHLRIWILASIMVAFVTGCGGDDAAEGESTATQPPAQGDHSGHGHAEAMSSASTPGDEDAETVTPYPLDTCLVMSAPLNAMGGAQRIEYEGQEWKFCCKGCIATFKQDPEKYQAKLEAAVAEQQEQ